MTALANFLLYVSILTGIGQETISDIMRGLVLRRRLQTLTGGN